MTAANVRMPRRRVAVIGAGAWGTTLAILAAGQGHAVSLVAHSEASATYMVRYRRHPHSLPGTAIPGLIAIESLESNTLQAAEVVIFAVPTQQLRDALTRVRDAVPGKPILSAVKGLEVSSLFRPAEVIRAMLGPATPVAVLSGPNLATEIAAGKPSTSVVASDVPGLAATFLPIFHSQRFRIYLSDDPIGVELGGALKNIVAIGAGIADGLAAGDNAKAAFMTRGIAEIARLGVACGAQPVTFAGLSGIGDLIATCSSPLSRNHRVGSGLAHGQALDDILVAMGEVAEGVPTTRAALALGARHRLELPIIEQMHKVLFEAVPVSEAIASLMERDPAHESPEPLSHDGR